MQQRQLRLGDILDDYCPRERRVTNHAVVAMIGDDVKRTRCTTCDAEHEYKHAKVPRQRRKADTPAALYAQVAANGPKRVAHEAGHAGSPHDGDSLDGEALDVDLSDTATTLEDVISDNGADNGNGAEYASAEEPRDEGAEMDGEQEDHDADKEADKEEGPVHRPLIRASLPRPEGQQPPARPIPEFTIRQPGGRPGRFRPRHQRGGGQQGQHFHGGNRGNGSFAGGPPRGMRPGGGGPRTGRHHGGPNRKRSK
jgi:hypothetical protein